MSDNKDRLTYRPEPETKQKIERWYQEDNLEWDALLQIFISTAG